VDGQLSAIALLLPIYHYGVKPTLVGTILNGRRYPLQRVAAATA